MPRPLRVFLCHASQDKPIVRKLHRYLKQRGVQPWLDELDLLPGENWEVEIPNAIFSSDVILVCLSKNSVNKEGFVQKEISFALDKAMEKPEGTIFVIPVKLEDCEVPKRLKQYQWVDLFRQDGYKRLMLGLQKRASGLGADVSPVVLDETRRTPKPEKKKLEESIVSAPVPAPSEEEVKEEPKKEIPIPQQEEKKPEVKFTQQKPFTKLLEPSVLFPQNTPPPDNVPIANIPPTKKPMRWLGIGSIIMLVVAFSGFGLNYLVNNSPEPTATIFPIYTVTPKPPTFTNVPFTPTPTLTKTLGSTPIRTPFPMPTLGIGSIWVRPADGMEMVYVPEGEFTMGSNDGPDNEKPAHQVYMDAYWFDRTEVTNAMYRLCVKDGICKDPATSVRSSEYNDYPVAYVRWDDAKNYCSWIGARLPTEAEWEKAGRGIDGRTYPWGNENDPSRFYEYDDSTGQSKPVGSFPTGASPYGVLDMYGSVFEWVEDWYSSTYYAISPLSNPAGPSYGEEHYRTEASHVVRGGFAITCYGCMEQIIAITVRSYYRPDYSPPPVGFRCTNSP